MLPRLRLRESRYSQCCKKQAINMSSQQDDKDQPLLKGEAAVEANPGAANKKNSKALLIGFIAMCFAVSCCQGCGNWMYGYQSLHMFAVQALGNSIFRVLQLKPLKRYALFSNLASTYVCSVSAAWSSLISLRAGDVC